MSFTIGDSTYKNIHFVGILGNGMSALAQYTAWHECTVSGSDRSLNQPETVELAKELEKCGCSLFPQDGSGITADTECVVVSTAIESSNPDIQKAQQFNLPVFHRSDVLAGAVAAKKTIAVAGTSGKSSVTALLFHILLVAGKKPSLITGASLHSLKDKGLIGNAFKGDSEFLIIEADESDGTLVKYHPFLSLFLNVSKDHKPIDEVMALFQQLSDQSTYTITNGLEKRFDVFNPVEKFYPTKERNTPTLQNLTAAVDFKERTYSIPYPGQHNSDNLLSALTVASFLSIPLEELSEKISAYQGIERRFIQYYTKRGAVVIDDYAHNPEKIAALFKTVQQLTDNVIAIFQPHGFAPLKFMFDEFVELFSTLPRAHDTVLFLPVFYAGGTASREIDSSKLREKLPSKIQAMNCDSKDHARELILQKIKDDTIVIVLGARDPSLPHFAQSIVKSIDKRHR